MKRSLVYILALALVLCSCDAEKAPEQETVAEEQGGENIELYLTSRESNDSALCNTTSLLETDCGIEDHYFTLKGNVIQRSYCKGEEEAAWIVGKYRVGDSGIICQMDKVYIVKLGKNGDPTYYDRGQFLNLDNKDPFLLERSACKGVRFAKRYNEHQRAKASHDGRPSVYGRMYFEQAEHANKMLEELRKVKALREL